MPRLFLAILLFASIGTVLTICIGKRLIGLNYESLQKEADFRFALVRVRENAESIAFYCGEGVERRETERRFGRVIENMG
jgi:putative ATP-binding cassette transporter